MAPPSLTIDEVVAEAEAALSEGYESAQKRAEPVLSFFGALTTALLLPVFVIGRALRRVMP